MNRARRVGVMLVVAVVVIMGAAWGLRHAIVARTTADANPSPIASRSLPPNLAGLERTVQQNGAISVVGIGSSVGNGAELPDPATQSPVGRLSVLLRDRYPRASVTTRNLSVDGSTAFDGAQVYANEVRPLHPTVLLIAFGMNDGQTAQFNSGETLTGSLSAMQ